VAVACLIPIPFSLQPAPGDLPIQAETANTALFRTNAALGVCAGIRFCLGQLVNGFMDGLIAGAGMYSATPQGRPYLSSFVVFSGFNCVLQFLGVAQAGALFQPLWFKDATVLMNIQHIFSAASLPLMVLSTYCGYRILTVCGDPNTGHSQLMDILGHGGDMQANSPRGSVSGLFTGGGAGQTEPPGFVPFQGGGQRLGTDTPSNTTPPAEPVN
jgi:hypothetical protein